MKDQLAALEKLQQIDIKLSGMEEKLNKYPKEINSLENELKSDRNQLNQLKDELNNVKLSKAQLDITLEEQQAHIKSSEKRLFEIKTHKEYEALQKEIAEHKKSCADLEDKILSDMETIESLEKEISKSEEELQVKESEYNATIEEHKKKIEELRSAYNPIKEKKDEHTSAIKHEFLMKYEKIRVKNGLAMALAVNETCTGCNMNIPAQLFNEVLTLSRMIQCPNCHRILFTEEILEAS